MLLRRGVKVWRTLISKEAKRGLCIEEKVRRGVRVEALEGLLGFAATCANYLQPCAVVAGVSRSLKTLRRHCELRKMERELWNVAVEFEDMKMATRGVESLKALVEEKKATRAGRKTAKEWRRRRQAQRVVNCLRQARDEAREREARATEHREGKVLKIVWADWRIAVEEEILNGLRGQTADLHRKGTLVRRAFGTWSLLVEVEWRKKCIRRLSGGPVWTEEARRAGVEGV